jgi:MFS family permease
MLIHTSHYHLSMLSKHRELRRLFATYGLCGIALAFVSVFGPIYLYRSGYSIMEILLYFLFIAIFKIFVLPIVFKGLSVIGSNKMMVVGIAFFVANFLLFATISVVVWPLWLLALAKAIGNACYYPAYRINFAAVHSKLHTGQQAAALSSLVLGLSVLAPLAGGVIATIWSVSGVYVTAAILFVIGAVVIWNAPQITLPKIDFTKVPLKYVKRDYVANFAYSFSGLAELFVWPIFISLIISSYAGIGVIGSFFVLFSIVVTMYIGKATDKKAGERKYIKYGIVIGTLYNVARIFAATTLHLIALGFFQALSSSLISSAYDKRYYTNAARPHWLEYLYAQEIANSIPWLVYFPILIVVSCFVGTQMLLLVGIIITIPALIGVSLINYNDKKMLPVAAV